MTEWRNVPTDGMGEGGIDTLPADVTAIATSAPSSDVTALIGVETSSVKDDDGAGRLVSGVGLIGIGTVVAAVWWTRALKVRAR